MSFKGDYLSMTLKEIIELVINFKMCHINFKQLDLIVIF